LIELLIVAAVIAILAAIAVPNFLEAQTRAKVSRARGDMRTIALAVEAYAVEYNGFLPDPDDDPRADLQNPAIWDQRRILCRLTTPVAYLSGFSYDPFNVGPAIDLPDPIGVMMTRLLFPGDPPYTYSYNTDKAPGRSRPQTYGITSLGPNRIFDSYKVQYFPDRRSGMIDCTYDPTNGTTSDGDLMYFSKGQP
jgi:hypothetical protein